ncbi:MULTISPECIES: DUF4870 domain-containing protein [Neobacillus]|uniref:DUF4870 domain-containing protein n=1 Tax=Neobacillus rhizophilus TaxID=2833579 RepID=A0A942YUK2_9BACI|nr:MULTISPECIES: DUF4870 domain-containing protein [Neobacillus]MBS4213209.1 DUF4870 domain-containing protein [Neobacillus rhizophilus]MBU8914668.1 DUF4870 domain-containing protein [Bacillus sp. FJAT-29953]
MESRKVLSSLCYFSIFFAGFLFPLVVYFASGDEVTKEHAKKSLLSHVLPIVLTPLAIVAFAIDFANFDNQFPVLFIVSLIVLAIIWVVVIIWNVIKGVKVLVAE